MLGHFLMKLSYHDKGQLASFLSFNDKWGQVLTRVEIFSRHIEIGPATILEIISE